eukprot:13761912-Ditylum_brightwellii.AAC.1
MQNTWPLSSMNYYWAFGKVTSILSLGNEAHLHLFPKLEIYLTQTSGDQYVCKRPHTRSSPVLQ